MKIHARRWDGVAFEESFERFPFPCSACNAPAGWHCVSKYTNKRTEPHRDRKRIDPAYKAPDAITA